MQQKLVNSQNSYAPRVALSFFTVILAIGLTILFYHEFRRFRSRVAMWLDGKEQVSMRGPLSFEGMGMSEEVLEAHEQWEEMCQDTENDALSLVASFLFCQTFRLCIIGNLPNEEGNEDRLPSVDGPHFIATGNFLMDHTYLDAGMLFISGIALFMLVVLFNYKFAEGMKERTCTTFDARRRFDRIVDTAVDIAAFSIAWVSFYGTQWILDTMNKHSCHGLSDVRTCGTGGMSGSISLALAVTVASYSAILVVRHLARDIRQDVLKDIVLSALKAPGLLIGFGWEKSFDQAVEAVSLETPYPKCVKVVLAVFVSTMVIRIWKIHIVPVIILTEQDLNTAKELKVCFEEDEENAKEHFREQRDVMFSRFIAASNTARTNVDWLKRRDELGKYVKGGRKDDGGKRAADLNHLRRLMLLAEEVAKYDVHSKGLFDHA